MSKIEAHNVDEVRELLHDRSIDVFCVAETYGTMPTQSEFTVYDPLGSTSLTALDHVLLLLPSH